MIIELLNGARFDIADYSLKRLFHYIPSANIEHNSVAVDGRSDIILNSKINNRNISVEFIYQAEDIFDYYLLRDLLNDLFLKEESYYIIFKNEPHKRWLVKCLGQYNIQPNKRMESFTVEFITLKTYAESVANTQSLKEWDANLWAWNEGITWDDDLIYTFNTERFQLNNLGNAIVDPRVNDLEITLRLNSTSDFIQLYNLSTGDIFRYNGRLTNTDELVLNGIRTTLNGVSSLSNTNKKLIRINPGINFFYVEGATVESVSFNFRFLYK